MMLPIFFGLLFQYQADPVRAAEQAERVLKAQTQPQAETAYRGAGAERKRFEDRYEALGRAMDAFTLAYNAGRGQIWPRKEAEALSRAIRDLQATSPWKLISRNAGMLK
jgi:hypothetical protein